jgi:ubiquinone/menaquinone biosynthesis C-methylase UbiE
MRQRAADKIMTVGGLQLTILGNPVYTRRDELVELYWHFHPRFTFLKNARRGASFLDLGAGDGGLATWLEWTSPKRRDIRMYAVDMEKGKFFDRYSDFQLCNLDYDTFKFEDEFFDAILGSHVFEHINNEARLLTELRRVARKGARVYLELPTPESKDLPKRQLLADAGINMSTLNFFDDSTHLRTFSLEQLSSLLEQAGFRVLTLGLIDNRYLEDEMLTYGVKHNDSELTTYAMWSKTHFAHYIVSEAV